MSESDSELINLRTAYGELLKENAALTAAMVEIQSVACGETQILSCMDDTDALEWIDDTAKKVLRGRI